MMLKKPCILEKREKENHFQNLRQFNLKNCDELFENNLNQVNDSKIQKFTNASHQNEAPTKETNLEGKKIDNQLNENINENSIEIFIELKKERETKESIAKENLTKENLTKENSKKETKLLGRKKKSIKEDGRESSHNKFADDNLRRKSKHIVLSELMEIINKKIYDIYNGNLGQGMLIKKLFTLNHEQKANTIINYNKEFLHKKIKDILSANISSRYTNFPKEHNKYLIEKLINEVDDIKRRYFSKLFNLTYVECLNHFIGKEMIEELNGMKRFEDVLKQYDNDPDYKTCLKYYIENFEQIINNKKSRNKKTKG